MLFPERPKKMTSTTTKSYTSSSFSRASKAHHSTKKTTTKVGVDERDIPGSKASSSSKVLLGIESLNSIEGVFVVLKRFFPKLIFRVLFHDDF